MMGGLLADLIPWAVGALLGLFALIGAWVGGKRSAAAQNDLGRATDYIETRKRMDETHIGDDPAALRDWLRARDPDKR